MPSSSSSALTTRSTSPTHSLNKQIILDEDTYTSAISDIIARDFFPSLAQLDATNDYLEAVELMDEERLERSVRRLVDLDHEQQASTPRYTPRSNPTDTPVSSYSSSSRLPPARQPKPSDTLSLDAFQARYTSSDNASFTSLLNAENMKRKVDYAWAWEGEKRVKRLKAAEGEGMRKLIQAGTSGIDGGPLDEGRGLLVGGVDVGEKGRLMIEAAQRRVAAEGEGGVNTSSVDRKGKGREVVQQSTSSTTGSDSLHLSSIVSTSSALTLIPDPSTVALATTTTSPPLPPTDLPLPSSSHLAQALVSAGLPPTAINRPAALSRAKQVGDPLAPRSDDRSRLVPEWPFKTRNSLMFGPGADEDPYNPVYQDDEGGGRGREKEKLELASQMPKSINHANTRMDGSEMAISSRRGRQVSSSGSSVLSVSPTRSRVGAAISGQTCKHFFLCHPSMTFPFSFLFVSES
jgi:hypothetical protein